MQKASVTKMSPPHKHIAKLIFSTINLHFFFNVTSEKNWNCAITIFTIIYCRHRLLRSYDSATRTMFGSRNHSILHYSSSSFRARSCPWGLRGIIVYRNQTTYEFK